MTLSYHNKIKQQSHKYIGIIEAMLKRAKTRHIWRCLELKEHKRIDIKAIQKKANNQSIAKRLDVLEKRLDVLERK